MLKYTKKMSTYVIVSLKDTYERHFYGFYRSDCPDDLYNEIFNACVEKRPVPLRAGFMRDDQPLPYGSIDQIRGVVCGFEMFDLDPRNDFKIFNFVL